MATARETNRLRALVETGIGINSELSLDGVLERIVEAAARVTAARYAALGVIDPAGSRLERFVTYGIEPEVQTQIGDPPHGRGILGVLIHDARPLRLHDLTEDPRSVGVETPRLYESATAWSQQLESLNEVGAALVGELELDPLLDLVATRLRQLIGARLVGIALPAGDGLSIAAVDGGG